MRRCIWPGYPPISSVLFWMISLSSLFIFIPGIQIEPRFVRTASQAASVLDSVTSALEELETTEADFVAGRVDEEERRWRVFGWGHHRVLAMKG